MGLLTNLQMYPRVAVFPYDIIKALSREMKPIVGNNFVEFVKFGFNGRSQPGTIRVKRLHNTLPLKVTPAVSISEHPFRVIYIILDDELLNWIQMIG